MELAWGTELDDELALQEIKDEYQRSEYWNLASTCFSLGIAFAVMVLYMLGYMILEHSLKHLGLLILFGALLLFFLILAFGTACQNTKRVSDVKNGKFQYRRAWIIKKGDLTNDKKEGYLWFDGHVIPEQKEYVIVPREVYDSVDVGNEMYLIYLKPPDKTFAVRAYKEQ